MEIKTWHKYLFVGSIIAFISYLNREKIKKQFSNLVSYFAGQWVGVKEIGDNVGFANAKFEQMLKESGWRSAEQWCMYFAKAIHLEALKNNPSEQSKVKKILSGSTQLSYASAKSDKTNTYTTSDTPKVGDIVIFQNKTTPSKGHAGIVTKVNLNNTIDTIEGNTSDKNISNGDLVAKKNRTSIVGKSIGGDLVVKGYIRKLNV